MKVTLTKTARILRSNSTKAELRLWFALRNRQLNGLKFKRQIPFGPYIVDFVCLDGKLIVEVDGGQHAETAQADNARTAYFEAQGYRVLRFWNNDVLENLEGVLETIAGELTVKCPLTQPSPQGERALDRGGRVDVPLPQRQGALSRGGCEGVPSPLGEKDRLRGSSA